MKALALAIIAALTAGLLLLGGTAEAQATRTAFTGTQTCGPTSGGEVTFPDGNIHLRGAISICDNVTTLPGGISVSYAVVNANLDSTFSGPIWSTARVERGGVAVFEGVVWGRMTGGTAWTTRLVFQGLGPLEGAKMFATSECHAVIGGSVCDMSGYLLVP